MTRALAIALIAACAFQSLEAQDPAASEQIVFRDGVPSPELTYVGYEPQ